MIALVWSPFGSAQDAQQAARTLIAEQLVACANILPPMESLFMWEGKICDSTEVGALFKTEAALLARAVARLEEIHPYDTPAIAGWRCDETAAATAGWLQAVLSQGRHSDK